MEDYVKSKIYEKINFFKYFGNDIFIISLIPKIIFFMPKNLG